MASFESANGAKFSLAPISSKYSIAELIIMFSASICLFSQKIL